MTISVTTLPSRRPPVVPILATATQSPVRVRVVTWNIHKGIGGLDRRYRLERVIAVLRRYEPDIMLLQEVTEGLPRSRYDDQLALLSGALALPHVAYGREHCFRVGGYGNAIVSRFPLTDPLRVDLTIGTCKKRGVLCARAHLPHPRLGRVEPRQSVMLFNLHLGLRGRERAEQLRRFLACHPFAGLHARTPTVVAGDMNDVWGTLGQRFFHPAGFARAGQQFNTFPAIWPLRPLDAIFIRGQVRPVRYRPGREDLARTASDHLPLVADLELG